MSVEVIILALVMYQKLAFLAVKASKVMESSSILSPYITKGLHKEF